MRAEPTSATPSGSDIASPGDLASRSDIASRSDAPLLRVEGLSVVFERRGAPPVRALDGVGFRLDAGETLGVVGESGCGKTTLMLSLLRLLPSSGRITGGEVHFGGRDLLTLSESAMADVRWRDLAIVFQSAMNALNPVRTVGDQIAEALVRHAKAGSARQAWPRVEELLEQVGIARRRGRQYPHQYSGGMRQRATIAMALACNPRIVIADEPTTALDVMVQAQILDLLQELRDMLGLAVILVTHDLGVVAEICDRVMVMYAGEVVEAAPVDVIFNAPAHPYTQALLAAFPDLSNIDRSLVSLPGHPPSLDALPAGCRFAPRCPHAFERCLEPPALLSVTSTNAPGARHLVACHLLAEEGG